MSYIYPLGGCLHPLLCLHPLIILWDVPEMVTLLFSKIKLFLQSTVDFATFHYCFEKNYFYCYILLVDQVLVSRCLYFVRYWAIFRFELFANQVLNCKVNFVYLIKSFFLHGQKVMKKNSNILRSK